VGGLGWDAALWGVDQAAPVEAERRDAAAVVALMYCGLTGRWPGATPSVTPPPPTENGVPVRASLLVAGVPGDLDALSALTLTPGRSGPETLAGVVDDLGPWLGREEAEADDSALFRPLAPPPSQSMMPELDDFEARRAEANSPRLDFERPPAPSPTLPPLPTPPSPSPAPPPSPTPPVEPKPLPAPVPLPEPIPTPFPEPAPDTSGYLPSLSEILARAIGEGPAKPTPAPTPDEPAPRSDLAAAWAASEPPTPWPPADSTRPDPGPGLAPPGVDIPDWLIPYLEADAAARTPDPPFEPLPPAKPESLTDPLALTEPEPAPRPAWSQPVESAHDDIGWSAATPAPTPPGPPPGPPPEARGLTGEGDGIVLQEAEPEPTVGSGFPDGALFAEVLDGPPAATLVARRSWGSRLTFLYLLLLALLLAAWLAWRGGVLDFDAWGGSVGLGGSEGWAWLSANC
jgi:hypothetical protein